MCVLEEVLYHTVQESKWSELAVSRVSAALSRGRRALVIFSMSTWNHEPFLISPDIWHRRGLPLNEWFCL